MSASQPHPLAIIMIYAALVVAYFFSFGDFSVLRAVVATAAALILLGGWHGQARRIAGLGVAGLTVLLLKDFTPMRLPWLTAWSEAAGFAGEPWWLAVRHPQVWVELQQAASLATIILGVAAVHAAWARGLVSRRSWLQVLAGLLLAWVAGLLLLTNAALPYGPGNSLPGVLSKNAAGVLAALGMIVCLGLAVANRRNRNRLPLLAWLVGAGLAGWAVQQVNSWTAVIGALTGVAWLVARTSRRGAYRTLWILCSLAAMLLAVLVLSPALTGRLREFGDDYRFAIWRDVLGMLAHQPLGGFGLGSFENTYPLFGQLAVAADARLMHPDSSWVLLAVEWGLLPLGLAGLGAWLLFRGNETDGQVEDRSSPTLTATIQAAVLCWAICGLTDPVLHRPATALVGFSLLPFLVRPVARAGGRIWPGLASALCLLLTAAGLWAGQQQARAEAKPGISPADLRADPLNTKLHWRLATATWNIRGDRRQALAHFRAVVTLDHRSMLIAETIARLLSGPEPEAARYFWQAAFTRGRTDPNRSAGLLESVARDFPGLDAAYWEEVILPAAPDLRLVLARRPDADSERLLRAWLEDGGIMRLDSPAKVTNFYGVLARIPVKGDLLAEALRQRPSGAPREFYLQAAERFHLAKDEDRAWQAMLKIEPWATLTKEGPSGFKDAPNRLWLNLFTMATGAGRTRLLEEICGQKNAHYWFHLELAKDKRAAGQKSQAVVHLLKLTHGIGSQN